jgi:FlaA1/EpsC-like NDP-sugar epimerase
MRVEVTGIRAGEKLHEVLAHRAEDLVGTGVEGVLCFTGRAPGREEVAGMVRDLECVRGVDDVSAVLEAIRRHAPTVGGSGGPDRRSEAA